jgi:predicted PurR-regulated permease PerM
MSNYSPLRALNLVSYILAAGLCALALLQGLVPGLLALCVGYLLTTLISRHAWGKAQKAIPLGFSAALVICAPLLGLALLLANAKGMTLSALDQYQALLNHLAHTVLEIREKLPASLAKQLPQGTSAIQAWVAEHLKEQSSVVAQAGKEWLHGALLAYVGLAVGALIAASARAPDAKPLALAIRLRALNFLTAFTQIVAAQFWIASFNTLMTALFLYIALPLADVHMPYALALVGLTFVGGMIPIVGNLMCNAVLALVGVSVSAAVGLSCLIFLISVHKFEYVISAKVLGAKTNTAIWELLTVMFICETLFGVVGLVCAPLYYAYLKKELQDAGLV